MHFFRKTLKPISICLTFLILNIFVPAHSVLAAMVDTEVLMDVDRGQEARQYLHELLARTDVQTKLVAQGIDPVEAAARMDSLSDEEIIRLADRIEQLPAGGSGVEFLLVVLLVGFIVFIILDLTGVWDVFPFIKSQR
jgi:hypothetical protein